MSRVVHFEIHAKEREAMEKMDVLTVGLLAYAKDPEGNLFGILQPDPMMPMPPTKAK
ncbi:MAG: hypothetical protein WCS97_03120 [Candidatus Paceibacterota bacterium]|jgi:hypothetical protein